MRASRGVVIDSSAIVAVLHGEPGAEDLIDHLDAAVVRLLSAATLVEASIVVEARNGPAGAHLVDQFVRDALADVVPFDPEHAKRALDGWRRYGKGRHPAALNLGDCFTYGLASMRELPILCVGEDFAATDAEVLSPVVAPSTKTLPVRAA